MIDPEYGPLSCAGQDWRRRGQGSVGELAVLGVKALLLVVLAGILAAPSGCSKVAIPVHDPGLKANPARYLRHVLRGKPEGFYMRTYRSCYLSEPPMFKPGAKAEVRVYSDDRIEFVVEGSEVHMCYRDLPFPTTPEGVQQVIEKHFAVTREELNLEGLDPQIRKQVDEGNVAIGMTKQQVFTALGFPSHVDNFVPADPLPRTRIFESSTWIYRYSEFPILPIYTSYWTYRFDSDGKLVQVIQ